MNVLMDLPSTAAWPDWLDDPAARGRLERDIFPRYIQQARWYRSKTLSVIRVTIESWTRLPPETIENGPVLAVLRLDHGETERYVLPLYLAAGDRPPEAAVICRIGSEVYESWLCDACYDDRFRRGLLAAMEAGPALKLGLGVLCGKPAPAWSRRSAASEPGSSRVLGAEQSNTGLVFSSGSFLKLYRRWEEGVHPEPEILRFLEERTDCRVAPEFRSSLEWGIAGRPPITAALLQRFVASEGNGWEYALRNLAGGAPSAREFLDWIEALGRRTAALHAALSSRSDLPDFAPEDLTAADIENFSAQGAALLDRTLSELATRLDTIASPEDADAARALLGRRDRLAAGFAPAPAADWGRKIRIHGDFHLGQVLRAADGIWFLDFEGETGRPLAEKRRKHSPLRDVAGMLRSFHYALHAAARADGATPAAGDLADRHGVLCDVYLHAYTAALADGNALSGETAARAALLRLFMLEKAVYELDYEMNNRPAWIGIPLQGLLALTSV